MQREPRQTQNYPKSLKTLVFYRAKCSKRCRGAGAKLSTASPSVKGHSHHASTQLRLARPLARTTRTRNESEIDFPVWGVLTELAPLNLRYTNCCWLLAAAAET